LHKWRVDEAYDFLFVNGLAKAAARAGRLRLSRGGRRVNVAGWLTRFTSRVSVWWDTWIVDGAVRTDFFPGQDVQLPGAYLQTGSYSPTLWCS
jgi:hypothetical protein